MIRKYSLVLLLLLSACTQQPKVAKQAEQEYLKLINWRTEWNDSVFDDAKAQGKPIILSLEARWCHWCHVMTEQTYTNPAIVQLLNEKFIALRIDQDTNSYLSNRYKRYGWPATIIFSPNGQELLKQAGYIEASEMQKVLTEILANPNKEVTVKPQIKYSIEGSLTEQAKNNLESKFIKSLDLKKGGLKTNQKYIDRDTLEYALYLSSSDSKLAKMAKQFADTTFKNALALLDPEWGGFYQYSTYGRWDKAHYEKLTEIQAEYIRIYSLAYLSNPQASYKAAIDKTIGYMNKFLSSQEAAFYGSQDADLIRGQKATDYFSLKNTARLKLGVPPIDEQVFSNKNGLMIEALLTAYRINADKRLLARAIKAYDAVTRLNYKGDYYVHSIRDPQPYLADNLYMARAQLALYMVTADRKWLRQSIQLAKYIVTNFRADEPGYLSLTRASLNADKLNTILKPEPLLAENIKLVRFFNLLSHYSGDKLFKEEAKYIMRYLASPDLHKISEPGILMANLELNQDPVHFTIVASKKDVQARKLFNASMLYPSSYLRLEWFDKAEGKLMNHDVEYPQLVKAAAFRCADRTCSLPIYEASELITP